jgi:hypothetical protein
MLDSRIHLQANRNIAHKNFAVHVSTNKNFHKLTVDKRVKEKSVSSTMNYNPFMRTAE